MSAWYGEPWTWKRLPNDEVGVIEAHGGYHVATFVSSRVANRVVKVMDAIAGIPDPEAFVKAHRELVEAAKGALVLLDLAGLCPPVNNQLAKALAACEAAGKEKG